jgi:hypothetical protein
MEPAPAMPIKLNDSNSDAFSQVEKGLGTVRRGGLRRTTLSGGVWGPAGVDDIHRLLRVKFDVDDDDVRDLIVVNIRSQAQIRLAANVAGAQAGVHRDKKGNPYLVLQNHRLISPVRATGRLSGR